MKHITKVLKAKKWNVMQLSSQSTDLNPIEHEFHFLKTRLKGKGQAGSEDSCSNVLQSITRNKIWSCCWYVPDLKLYLTEQDLQPSIKNLNFDL